MLGELPTENKSTVASLTSEEISTFSFRNTVFTRQSALKNTFHGSSCKWGSEHMSEILPSWFRLYREICVTQWRLLWSRNAFALPQLLSLPGVLLAHSPTCCSPRCSEHHSSSFLMCNITSNLTNPYQWASKIGSLTDTSSDSCTEWMRLTVFITNLQVL